MAFLRLGLEHVDGDRVADRELGLRLGMAVELAVADDAPDFADVDEDLVLVDRTTVPSTTSPCLKP